MAADSSAAQKVPWKPMQSPTFKIFAAAALATFAMTLTSPAFAQRGASCHNGMNFPQFLSSLEQDAQKTGVSPRAISAAAPYMVYDQGIVNRDRGQRVFGQLFTQFAGRMASEARPCARAAAHQTARASLCTRREGVRRAGAGHHRASGRWRAISAPTWASCRHCARSSRSPMTAAAREMFQDELSPR